MTIGVLCSWSVVMVEVPPMDRTLRVIKLNTPTVDVAGHTCYISSLYLPMLVSFPGAGTPDPGCPITNLSVI